MSAVALLAVVSCRSLPVAPSLSPLAQVGAEIPTSALAQHDAEPPSIHDVRIARHGDAIDFTIALLPGSATERLPLDTYPQSRTSWTFQLSLDTDQDGAMSPYGGADYALFLLPGNVLGVYRVSGTGSSQVATVAVTVQPGRVKFSVPASVLGDDDGWMDFVLRIYRVEVWGGERDYFLASMLAGTNNVLPDQSRQVPAITDVRTEVRADTLYLRAQFLPRDPSYRTSYDPEKPGGWCLQLFLNTDQARTGYWRGYDYIVRGVEWCPDGSFVTRRIAPDETGWGPQTGGSRFTLRSRTFELAVPLSAIGADDGLLDYALEQYATVDCPERPGGFSAEYFADSFGTTGSSRGRRIVARGSLQPVDGALRGGGVHPPGLAMERRLARMDGRDRD